MLTDFQNSFTGRLISKFATKSYVNIPSHLKRVATLPCEISVVTAASSEALPDESMGSNDETILTPVNADNDGN